ncbi:transglycosylase domain-containing protein [Bacillus horti]|uniref:Penicillin-binding protein n=1 Tax=Caldalkalibacillus horti TaxID=77523 RepID=A0ABT9W0Z8_9BACI|nr:transglycosylase domain-containing protein [Bacillus horti]MDQ0166775.1 penicillin-binding protein [Bacillus horti]
MVKNQSTTNKSVKPKKKKGVRPLKATWIVMQVLLVLAVMGVLFTGGVAAGFLASHVQDEPLRDYDEIYNYLNNFNQTGEAYFKNDEFIGYLRTAEVSQPVTLEEVSQHLVDAILATEDHIFYEHNGINPRAVSRAVIEQFTMAGDGSGGSTITQQVVKNQILGPDRSFERKFKEMLLAMRLERMFNKNEILETYLNMVYMGYNANGSNIEGVKAASEGIFGVDVKDLNIAQSAYLAGMIQSPGRYTPFTRSGVVVQERLDNGLNRMNHVLNRMLETEMINQSEYNEAKSFDIKASLAKPTPGIVERYPFLTFEIERRAIDILFDLELEKEGIAREDLTDEQRDQYREHARRQLSVGGYKVYTTIDRELYEAFHEIAQDPELFGPRSRENTYVTTDEESNQDIEQGYLEQTAVTLIDNETGAIIAMIEGRDFNELQYNLNREPRQPGSSIKPLLDFGPAMELGLLQPASVIDDAPIFKWDVSTSDYWVPRNWNNNFQGLVTVRQAMNQSYNLPAIKALMMVQEEAGEEVPFDFLKDMGITTITQSDIHATPAAIGGMTYGLTVEENTSAFSTFANKGVHKKSYLIERIETLDGTVVYEQEYIPKQVFSEQTAFLMNDLLRTVVNNGTASRIRGYMGSELEIAGKTGTTNDDFDYWFVGYTPQVTMGVWTGYEKRERLQGQFSQRNHNLWSTLMKKVEEIRPEYVNKEEKFEMPEDIVRGEVCSKSGMLPSDLCRQSGYLVSDYFNRQYLPTEVDDRVMNGRMVTVNGESYIAHDNTPDDFITTGFFIRRDPLNIPEQLESQRHRYLPLDWDNSAPSEIDPRVENGKDPDRPVNVRASWRNNAIEVTWNPVADDDIAGYRIYRTNANKDFEHIASVTDNLPKQFRDESANSGTVYAYQIVAVDIAGNTSETSAVALSDQIDQDSFFEPDQKVPSAPTGVSASHGMFGVDLSWSANTDSDGVKLYTIYYSTQPNSGFQILTETITTQYSHAFLDVPEAYYYYITATNDEGQSNPSNVVKMSFQNDDVGDTPDNPDDSDDSDDE